VIAFSSKWFFAGLAVIGLLGVVIGWLGFRGGKVVNEFQHEHEPDPDVVNPAVAA
jgi:inositol transporter-like SP family MFS transporter